MINKVIIESLKSISQLIWFFIGGMCCMSPWMVGSDDNTASTIGVVFLCLLPLWMGFTKVYGDKIFKL